MIDQLALFTHSLSTLFIVAFGAMLEWRVYLLLPLVPVAFYKEFSQQFGS